MLTPSTAGTPLTVILPRCSAVKAAGVSARKDKVDPSVRLIVEMFTGLPPPPKVAELVLSMSSETAFTIKNGLNWLPLVRSN